MDTSSTAVPAGTGRMAIPDQTGHTVVATWKHDDPAQIEEMRAKFDEIIAQGYTGYKTEPGNPQDSEVLTRFEPDATSILFFRRLVGG